MRWGKAHAHRTLQLHNRLELFSQTLGQGRKAWLAPVGGNQGAANEVNGCERSARQSYFTRPAVSRWLPCRVAQPEDVTVSCCSIAAAHNPERFPPRAELDFRFRVCLDRYVYRYHLRAHSFCAGFNDPPAIGIATLWPLYFGSNLHWTRRLCSAH